MTLGSLRTIECNVSELLMHVGFVADTHRTALCSTACCWNTGHPLTVIVRSEENETKWGLQGKLDFPNFGMLLGQGKKLFNCWQFGDFQMTSLIGMIFSDYNVCIHWAGEATNKVILHPGTDASFFSFFLKGFCNLWGEKRLKLLSAIICYSLTTCLFEAAIAWWNAGSMRSLP